MLDVPNKPEKNATGSTPPPRWRTILVRELPAGPARGFLAGMRIRKKLFVLHTLFSLGLALLMLLIVRPAIMQILDGAERQEATALLRSVALGVPPGSGRTGGFTTDQAASVLSAMADVELWRGAPGEAPIDPATAARLQQRPGEVTLVPGEAAGRAALLTLGDPSRGDMVYVLTVRLPEAREAVTRLYWVLVLSLLLAYAFIAAALEVFVLPTHVYGPIRRMLAADRALQDGRRDAELIDANTIPRDELGEIMRSRNDSVRALRTHQSALGDALQSLETVAADLKRKNHLLEAARRNLADADRLASLGMMSAGIAHELNTPLAVLKGCVEQINRDPASLDPARAALMLRVVQRLERLSESLLDFARVRPPVSAPTSLAAIVDEAMTLLRLDREYAGVDIASDVPATLIVECDADRMIQVLVNLLRNAAQATDSIRRDRAEPSRIRVTAQSFIRDGVEWVGLTITDNGPGIDPDVLSRLFEPFVSTRLDSRGTGLGLAVADGIVREHGGVLLARNLPGRSGAVFEVVLPIRAIGPALTPSQSPAAIPSGKA
ncbi:MAG: ATP-binding protein [Planctomycetota bacterium]|nr:ATP-binding protein [Planctomycetota bacterium]